MPWLPNPILISDGDGNLSLETLAHTLEMAQKSDVSIFTISTNSSRFFGIAAPKADKVLKRLAEDTGGRAFFPFKAEDFSESFQDISAELRSQYSVAYRSSNAVRDGSFRSIKIETDRKNLKVKARKGLLRREGIKGVHQLRSQSSKPLSALLSAPRCPLTLLVWGWLAGLWASTDLGRN